MPYERVLSGPEGRLLYGPEFSDEVFSDYVFFLGIDDDDDVFFLGIGGEILTRVWPYFHQREIQISTVFSRYCSVKKREIGQFLVQNVRDFR